MITSTYAGTHRYMPVYHADTVNHCPGCARTHWYVGRATAQCCFCDTALPLALGSAQLVEPLFWSRSSQTCKKAA